MTPETVSSARLEARDVGKNYGGVVALDGVSFSVGAGEVVGLVGPNGAGKTTLVDAITGAQSMDSGRIWVNGEPLSGSVVDRARSGLARTFQHPLIAEELTAVENISVGTYRRRFDTLPRLLASFFTGAWGFESRPNMAECEQIARDVGLEDSARMGRDLTLGERRLTEVARAFASEPSVLLLDEPFAGSDTAGTHGIRNAISLMRERMGSVLLVDHNVDLVAAVSDRMVLLDRGQIVFAGSSQECLASAEMRSVYFG